MEVWVSNEILQWRIEEIGWAPGTSRLGRLANEEWDHGSLRLGPASQDLPDGTEDRKDAIAALWRAVERRVQLFEEVYAIRTLLGIRRRERVNLGHLEQLGLVRGSILDDIRRLRNAIQHRSEFPPSQEQCLLYRDAVWYFLRSTEHFAQRTPNEFWFINDSDTVVRPLNIVMRLPEWSVRVQSEGIPKDLVSGYPRDGWIPVKLAAREDAEIAYFVTSDDSVYMTGFITDLTWLLRFARIYFSLA